jgi:glycosyltransferase involved in cell wall biosynthesis
MIRPGENGYLVTPGASGDLARRLNELLGDPARRRAMGTASRARAESEFSLAGMIRRYEALYLDAVRAGARRSRDSGARAPEREAV